LTSTTAHLVCEGCGEPGVCEIEASGRPHDVAVTCPHCGFEAVVACAGVPVGRDEPDHGDPDMIEAELRAMRPPPRSRHAGLVGQLKPRAPVRTFPS
jgi:hypothetical protein